MDTIDEIKKQQESAERFNETTKKDQCPNDESKKNLRRAHDYLGEASECYWDFLIGRFIEELAKELIELNDLLTQ